MAHFPESPWPKHGFLFENTEILRRGKSPLRGDLPRIGDSACTSTMLVTKPTPTAKRVCRLKGLNKTRPRKHTPAAGQPPSLLGQVPRREPVSTLVFSAGMLNASERRICDISKTGNSKGGKKFGCSHQQSEGGPFPIALLFRIPSFGWIGLLL